MFNMARGCFHVPEGMCAALVGIRLEKVGRITEEITRQLQSLSGLTVQEYHSPAPPGLSAKPVPADLHFSTFIGALLAVIDYGIKYAPVMCWHRVRDLREGLMAVEGKLRGYLQYHRIPPEPFPEQVRDALIVAINEGFDEATYTLAVESADISRRHQPMPPPPGSGPEFKLPEFVPLHMLLEEGGTNSLAVRSVLWGSAPAKTTGPGAGKRRAVPGSSTKQETGTKNGPGPVGGESPSRPGLLPGITPSLMHVVTHGAAGVVRVLVASSPTNKLPRRCAPRPRPWRGTRSPLLSPPPPPPPQSPQQVPGSGATRGATEEGAGRRVTFVSAGTTLEAGAECLSRAPARAGGAGGVVPIDNTGPAFRQGRPRGGGGFSGASATFADVTRLVGLHRAPKPGSVPPAALFHGECVVTQYPVRVQVFRA